MFEKLPLSSNSFWQGTTIAWLSAPKQGWCKTWKLFPRVLFKMRALPIFHKPLSTPEAAKWRPVPKPSGKQPLPVQKESSNLTFWSIKLPYASPMKRNRQPQLLGDAWTGMQKYQEVPLPSFYLEKPRCFYKKFWEWFPPFFKKERTDTVPFMNDLGRDKKWFIHRWETYLLLEIFSIFALK